MGGPGLWRSVPALSPHTQSFNPMVKNNKSKKSKNESGGSFLYVDPERIRFQHSKIRPYFSGCGRSVVDTLDSIRKGHLRPEDLPPIQVIVGPDENDGKGPWYFSLNNRRLWVLKRCREEGLLQNNSIRVRVREAKSGNELERYTLKNCVVEARFMREQMQSSSTTTTPVTTTTTFHETTEHQRANDMKQTDENQGHVPTSTTNNKRDVQGNDSSNNSLNHDNEHNDDGGDHDDDDDDGMERKPFYNPFGMVDDDSSSSSDESA